jgi:hypothetical protein
MAEPGRLIVDTMVLGPDTLTKLPRFSTLTITARDFSGVWNDLRVIKAPRVRNGFTRVVFEDSRWKLRDTIMKENYNERDGEGNVLTGMEKTISELVDEISTISEVSMQTGDVPDFKPPARWAGERASDAFAYMLEVTGCRCVYNPIVQDYNIEWAGRGADLNAVEVAKRVYRPGPPSKVKELVVKTAPVLYEDRFDAKAVTINSTTGAVSDLSSPVLATDPAATDAQTKLRLWAPDTITHPEALGVDDVLMLDHRAKTHLFDPLRPTHERARVVRDSFDRYPVHQPLYAPEGQTVRLLELTGGGRVFVADHPVLMTDSGGELLVEAQVLSGYYVKETDVAKLADGLKRNSETVVIDGDATDTIEMVLPWLKPVDSTESDVDSGEWDALLLTVANAVAQRYLSASQNSPDGASVVRCPSPFNLFGSGKVGAVEYEMSTTQNTARIYFTISWNFDPGHMGSIR